MNPKEDSGLSRSTETIFTVTCDSAAAMSEIFKGKLEGIDGSLPCSSVQESDDEVFSCDSAASVDSVHPSTSNHFTGQNTELSTD
ncbi:hypothetical protein AB1E18_001458 [Capra hircus]